MCEISQANPVGYIFCCLVSSTIILHYGFLGVSPLVGAVGGLPSKRPGGCAHPINKRGRVNGITSPKPQSR